MIFDRIDIGSSSETRKRETGRGTAEDEKSHGEEVRRNEEGKERKGKAEVERNEGTEEEEEEEESGGMGCFWSRHHDTEAPTLDVVESQRPELGLWFFFCFYFYFCFHCRRTVAELFAVLLLMFFFFFSACLIARVLFWFFLLSYEVICDLRCSSCAICYNVG